MVTSLLPDPDEAREWAEKELTDPAYRAAEPTPIDLGTLNGRAFLNVSSAGIGAETTAETSRATTADAPVVEAAR